MLWKSKWVSSRSTDLGLRQHVLGRDFDCIVTQYSGVYSHFLIVQRHLGVAHCVDMVVFNCYPCP